MKRLAHPNKHVEAALRYAEKQGWRVEKGSGMPKIMQSRSEEEWIDVLIDKGLT